MKHVIGLSGGKDSTALALALREREPRDYEYVFTPTGNEQINFYGDGWDFLAFFVLGQMTALLSLADPAEPLALMPLPEPPEVVK